MSLRIQAEQPFDREPTPEVERLALKLLATREHSRFELARKLAERGFDHLPIAGVLDRLEGAGLVDDARVAEQYIRERVGKGFGPLRIRGELRQKGLADDLIDRYLDPWRDEWPVRLAQAHERHFGSDPPGDRAEFGRRARFLEQRGFTADSIRRFLRWDD